MKLKLALFVNLFLFAMIAGLHLGGTVYYNAGLDKSPQNSLITVQQHIELAFKPSIGWFMALTVVSAAPTIYFAWRAKSRLLPYAFAGFVCFLAGLISTLVVNVPINSQFLKWSATNPPADWLATRHRWDIWNDFRTVMFILGFAILFYGVISLAPFRSKKA